MISDSYSGAFKLFPSLPEVKARSRGTGMGARHPPEIFRFQLNSATEVEFCLLKSMSMETTVSKYCQS